MQRIVGRYENDGRFGGHVVPFDQRVLHELFIPPGRGRAAQAGRDGRWPRSRGRPRPRATRSAACSRCSGRLEDPGRRPQGRHGEVRAARRVPAGGRGGGGARAPGGAARRTSTGRTDFRPWATVTVDPETARDHDDAISLDRLPDGALAAGRAHRGRGPLRPRGLAPRPGGLPARDLRLLPGPRGADAAARALQQHLQPGRGPGPPDPDGRAGARRARRGPQGRSSTTA